MDGQVPASTTYREWIKKQPRDVQDIALGPARAAKLRAGMGVERFTDPRGRILTLRELERLETA